MPEPMIPSSLVSLDSLPLSPNGKVDRSALPSVTDEAYGPQTEYAPPRTTAEEILAAIVADLLGRSRVGIHDNFSSSASTRSSAFRWCRGRGKRTWLLNPRTCSGTRPSPSWR